MNISQLINSILSVETRSSLKNNNKNLFNYEKFQAYNDIIIP